MSPKSVDRYIMKFLLSRRNFWLEHNLIPINQSNSTDANARYTIIPT